VAVAVPALVSNIVDDVKSIIFGIDYLVARYTVMDLNH
jgi:hypothetical protein